MKKSALGSLLLLLMLGGCGVRLMAIGTAAGNAASMYATKTPDPPPADTSYNMQPHETWCYRTMAEVECYSTPQDVPPSRLVNVDPQYYYPMTPDGYSARLTGLRPEAPSKPEENDGFLSWLGF